MSGPLFAFNDLALIGIELVLSGEIFALLQGLIPRRIFISFADKQSIVLRVFGPTGHVDQIGQ
jgi:hypothetical protein